MASFGIDLSQFLAEDITVPAFVVIEVILDLPMAVGAIISSVRAVCFAKSKTKVLVIFNLIAIEKN